ncbi:hypothetical protein PIROE2DRAFT_61278 [Piromyces sp. E2]|nr:hypothetical protein PIROE2DRAFT_61278 [Piromyces sp. E2]|eukprot:OUM63461.1 hypothetical protein PIROE2DRAFT_61278 [Piromyces sp. E2]
MLNELQLTQWIDEHKDLIKESCKNETVFISLTKLINKALDRYEDKKVLLQKIEKDVWKNQNLYYALFKANGNIEVYPKDIVESGGKEKTEEDLIEKICTNEASFNDFINKLFNFIDRKEEKQKLFYEIIEKKIQNRKHEKDLVDLVRSIPEKYRVWIKSHQDLIKEACYIKRKYKQLIQEIGEYCNYQVVDVKELYDIIEK